MDCKFAKHEVMRMIYNYHKINDRVQLLIVILLDTCLHVHILLLYVTLYICYIVRRNICISILCTLLSPSQVTNKHIEFKQKYANTNIVFLLLA